MRHIFVDESGCISFGPGGTEYFVLAFVSTEDGTRLSKCIKNFNAHLIRNGWPKDLEVKASNLWHAPNSGAVPADYKYKNKREEPVEYVLKAIAALDVQIEYAVVKLDTIKTHLRKLPYGILYNFFAWQLLKRPLCYFPRIDLYIDRRNRESHEYLKFDGYVEGMAAEGRANKGREALTLATYHYHSDLPKQCKPEDRPRAEFGVRGLEAADLVCWAIKWKYENGNQQWYSLIQGKVTCSHHLYFDEKVNAAGKK
ncbi:MAG TPA: DUF3800 domain-containing protein [Terriglobales bacterium]|nr:DUF3800 domain-containing protein [Terriglobales bacterium]